MNWFALYSFNGHYVPTVAIVPTMAIQVLHREWDVGADTGL